eukprot:4109347-Amphidinium_carterae.2
MQSTTVGTSDDLNTKQPTRRDPAITLSYISDAINGAEPRNVSKLGALASAGADSPQDRKRFLFGWIDSTTFSKTWLSTCIAATSTAWSSKRPTPPLLAQSNSGVSSTNPTACAGTWGLAGSSFKARPLPPLSADVSASERFASVDGDVFVPSLRRFVGVGVLATDSVRTICSGKDDAKR